MNEDNNTLTRQKIARRLRDDLGSLTEAQRFTNLFFETLSDVIAENDKTKIHQFGFFHCIRKRKRIGRNPKTGVVANISARRVVQFIAGDYLKNKINRHDDS